jgi:hypothetical protein
LNLALLFIISERHDGSASASAPAWDSSYQRS